MLLAVGCKKDNDSGSSPTDPNTPVPDPEGTITANISENTSIGVSETFQGFLTIGAIIKWINPNNFDLSSYSEFSTCLVSICDMGEMRGLGNITNIPETGFTVPSTSNKTVACQKGHGYLIKFGRSNSSVLVSLYVEESIVNANNEIIGAKVKYQYPFPVTLTVSTNNLSFPTNGGTKTLDIASNAVDWSYTTSDSWLQITREANILSILAMENEYAFERTGHIILKAYQKEQIITVKQNAGTLNTTPPYKLGDFFCENGSAGVVYKISNNGLSGMIVSLNETECAWSTANELIGCSDMDNGRNNMAVIRELSGWTGRFPAFRWCDDLNSGSDNGWCLPAKNELAALYAGFCGLSEFPGEESDASIIYKASRDKFNATLTSNGGVKITESNYWSSSEYASNFAWHQSFRNGHQTYHNSVTNENKSDYWNHVRAVRAF